MYVMELMLDRTNSAPKSVLHLVVDKARYCQCYLYDVMWFSGPFWAKICFSVLRKTTYNMKGMSHCRMRLGVVGLSLKFTIVKLRTNKSLSLFSLWYSDHTVVFKFCILQCRWQRLWKYFREIKKWVSKQHMPPKSQLTHF